ncbi:condensation domain-containing protein, partial [Streptomyces sp. NPDC005071]
GRYELVLTAHHVLFDGWSLPLLLKDLLWVYADGDDTGLPRVPSYRTFLAWLAGRDRQESLRAWQSELAGVTEPTLLAGTGHRPGDGVEEVEQIDVPLPAETARKVARRAADLGVTLNTVVQGAWAILLSQLTGQRDVVFGAAVNGRPADLAGSDEMVGLFINTLPTRVRVDGHRDAVAWLRELQEEQAEARRFAAVSLAELTSLSDVPAGGALFESMVAFENYPFDEARSATTGIRLADVSARDATNYPLVLRAYQGERFGFDLAYDPDLFDPATAERAADRLAGLLTALADGFDTDLTDLDLLTAADRELLAAWNTTARPAVPRSPVDLFAEQAR